MDCRPSRYTYFLIPTKSYIQPLLMGRRKWLIFPRSPNLIFYFGRPLIYAFSIWTSGAVSRCSLLSHTHQYSHLPFPLYTVPLSPSRPFLSHSLFHVLISFLSPLPPSLSLSPLSQTYSNPQITLRLPPSLSNPSLTLHPPSPRPPPTPPLSLSLSSLLPYICYESTKCVKSHHSSTCI